MREVLSQSEIDNLLKSLEQGELKTEELLKEQPKVRKYDFRRPNRFSKANLRVLSQVHENFSRQVANFLSAYLRASVSAKLATVDQVAFEDVVVSLPANTLVTVFSLNEEGLALINTGADATIAMIDLICGGAGDQVKKHRPITEIELAIYQRLSNHMLDRYVASWRETSTIFCKLESIETNARLIQSIAPGEMVAVISLTISINKVQDVFTVCLPFRTMEAILNKPGEVANTQEGPSIQEQWQNRSRTLQNASLNLTAMLGSTEIMVKDFLQLAVGDVVGLNKKPGELLDLYVENRRAFSVQPGSFNNQLAVQIVAPVTEGDDELEQ